MTKNKLFLLFFFIGVFLFGGYWNSAAAAINKYSEWAIDTALPYNASGNQSFISGESIYNFGGGDNNIYHTDILSSTIHSDGSLSEWMHRGDMPIVATWFSLSNKDQNVYLLGGAKPDPNIPTVSSIDLVYKSKIDTGGNISTWDQQPPLPQKLARGGSFIYNSRIYFIGGLIHSNNSAETVVGSVYFSKLNDDGSLNDWVQTANLPQPRAEFALFNIGNRVYVVNGMQGNFQPTNSVYEGVIDPDNGHILWTAIQNTPFALRRPLFAIRNQTLYLIGGYDGSSFTKNTYYSNITNNGLDVWQQINVPLLSGTCCSSAVANNKSIYLLGGHDGTSYFADVLRSDINSALNVPDLKQYSDPWGKQEYDTAHIWSPGKESISRYGCALTSATMVLKYYGYEVSPDSLNTWLLNNHGYIGDGYVDWSAITRWAKINHDLNPVLPKLEYSRKKFETTILDKEIQSQHPSIIKLVRPDGGTHFVTIIGKEISDYNINDPAGSQELLSYYPSIQYSRIDTFTPSNTDLSYLYFYTNGNMKITVQAPDGSFISDVFDTDRPYIDQVDQSVSNQEALATFALQKPISGEYVIRMTGNGDYNAETRIYSNEGDLTQQLVSGHIIAEMKKTFIVQVGTNAQSRQIDFAFIRQNMMTAYKGGLFKSKIVYNSLLLLLNTAEKVEAKEKSKPAIKILEAMKVEFKIAKKYIDPIYGAKLAKYITYLEESL